MNRDQFLDALAVLVERYEQTGGRVGISQEEAGALVRLFDAGQIESGQLPLGFEEATRGEIVQLTAGRAAETLATEAASMAVIDQTGVVPAIALNAPHDQQINIAHQAMEVFDRDVRQLAQDVLEGSIRGRDWHSQMIVSLRQHLLQQAQLGKGAPLTPDELSEIQDLMREDARFLKRFADEVAVRNELAESAEEIAERRLQQEGREVTEEAVQELAEELRGRPMTEDEIAARARQYKANAYEEFWRKGEEQIDDADVVVDYVAVDDQNTCSPCYQAEQNGPYLPGQGVFPGEVCLGGGHCRCVRRRRTDAETAAELRGE